MKAHIIVPSPLRENRLTAEQVALYLMLESLHLEHRFGKKRLALLLQNFSHYKAQYNQIAAKRGRKAADSEVLHAAIHAHPKIPALCDAHTGALVIGQFTQGQANLLVLLAVLHAGYAFGEKRMRVLLADIDRRKAFYEKQALDEGRFSAESQLIRSVQECFGNANIQIDDLIVR